MVIVLSTFGFRDYFHNLVVVVHVSLCNLFSGCSPKLTICIGYVFQRGM